MADAHSVSLEIVPTEDWLAAIIIRTEDEYGGETEVTLMPHESAMMGQVLLKYGVLMDTLNARLQNKTPEGRKETMELTAQFNLPEADDPFEVR